MSPAVPPSGRPALPRLPDPTSIDDVIANLEVIIAWAIGARSTVGYFAALYKRVTVAIRKAVDDGMFDDGPRMQRFDVLFAGRYFTALNAYFHPGRSGGPTLPWQVAFVGDRDPQPIIVQQMLTAINAHIGFDLGIAAATVAPTDLDSLAADFNRVNALLAGQIPGMLDVIGKLSPELRETRWLIPNETWLIKQLLVKFRTAAWDFATEIVEDPADAAVIELNHAAWMAALGAWYLHPPARLALFPILVGVIGKRESRDVSANIKALAGITDKPDMKRVKKFL